MTIHRDPELPDGEAWDRYVEWLGRRAFAGGNVDREHYFQSAEREIAIFREMGIAFSGRSALEFGCGDGRLLCNLIGRFPELTGVDASKAALRSCADSLAEWVAGSEGSYEPVLRHGGPSALRDLPTGSFDLVISVYVAQHMDIDDVRGLVHESRRLLCDGGHLAIHFASAGFWRRGRDLVLDSARVAARTVVGKRIEGTLLDLPAFESPWRRSYVDKGDIRELLVDFRSVTIRSNWREHWVMATR